MQLSPIASSLLTSKIAGKRISESDLSEQRKAINFAIKVLGVTITESSEAEFAKNQIDLIKFIQANYANRTLEEIKHAFTLLVTRKLPGQEGKPLEPFRMLDINSFCSVLFAYDEFYKANTEVQEVLKSQLLLPAKTDDLSDEEKESINVSAFQERLNTVKEKGYTEDFGGGVWEWLKQTKRVTGKTFSKDEWEDMKLEAETIVTNKLQAEQERNKTDLHRYRHVRQILLDLEKEGTENKEWEALVKKKAAEIALNKYLKTIIENEKGN